MNSFDGPIALKLARAINEALSVADSKAAELLRQARAIAQNHRLEIDTKCAVLDEITLDATTLALAQRGSTSAAAALHAISAVRMFFDLSNGDVALGTLEIVEALCEECTKTVRAPLITNVGLN